MLFLEAPIDNRAGAGHLFFALSMPPVTLFIREHPYLE
jgi:hypothetical protein